MRRGFFLTIRNVCAKPYAAGSAREDLTKNREKPEKAGLQVQSVK
jgi:hypothetical protein